MAPRKSRRAKAKAKVDVDNDQKPAAIEVAAVAEDIHDDDDGWTTDHHLVGSTICPTAASRLILRPIEPSVEIGRPAPGAAADDDEDDVDNNKNVVNYLYAMTEQSLQAAAFEPEDRMQRKPALWRCLVHNTAVENSAASSKNQQEEEEEEKDQVVEYCQSVDCLSTDWQPSSSQQRTSASLPSRCNLGVATVRIQTVVLDHILQNMLPNLVMVAAIEEVRNSFLKQAAAEMAAKAEQQQQEHGGHNKEQSSRGKRGRSNKSSSGMELPPRYYSRPPNSYLSPPVAASSSNNAKTDEADADETLGFVLPVQFTPNQLVHRIKNGCAMLYQLHQDKLMIDKSLLPTPTTTTTVAAASSSAGVVAPTTGNETRRASSRIARQLELPPPPPPPPATTTTTTDNAQSSAAAEATKTTDDQDQVAVPEYWKVRQGGIVAAFLHDELFSVTPKQDEEEEPSSPPTTSNEETAEDGDVAEPQQQEEAAKDGDAATMEEQQQEQQQVKTGDDGKADNANVEDDKKPAAVDDNNKANGVDVSAAELEEAASLSSSEEEISKKDDDDYTPTKTDQEDDDDDDDEVMEDVEEEETLSKVESEEEEEEEEEDVDEVEEDEDDEDVEVVNDSNPYLQPGSLSILDWLGRKTAKLCTSAELQIVFPELVIDQQSVSKKGKRKKMSNAEAMAALVETGVGKSVQEIVPFDVDRYIWEKMLSTNAAAAGGDDDEDDANDNDEFTIGPSARLVLQSVSHEKIADLDEWETAYFGRQQFNLRLLDASLEEARNRHSAEDITQAELAYKEQKAWDQLRYKGLHGGYTKWPSWTVALTKWHTTTAAALGEQPAATVAATASAPEQPGDGTAAAAPGEQDQSSEQDKTMAQELARQEESANLGKGRRATRRGGDTGGVFYGSHSNMSQKQLMDTILRLVSQRPMGTVMGLISAIADDSSDPLRRMRISLGRLLWRRNQIARLPVQTERTDQLVWERLSKGSLLTVSSGKDTHETDISEYDSLLEYVRGLHKTELQLRNLVLKHLTDIPVAVIAAAADERKGSTESADHEDFEDPASIEWKTSGHELLNEFIFRPSHQHQSDNIAPCHWYRIQDYVPSIAATVEEGAGPPERPPIGSAKDTISVERRARFRVIPDVPDDVRASKENPSEPLILTEAQVRAGLKAAEMERKQGETLASTENPFAGVSGSQVSLIPAQSLDGIHQINGVVTGHNTTIEAGKVTQKVQVLPVENSSVEQAFWTTLESASDGSYVCRVGEEPTLYTIRQFDYTSSSPAFQECRAVIEYIRRQAKASPFLEPVDPVALNIPHYFEVIKKPMDLGTLSDKLDQGVYSNIPPGDAHGTSPITRMLNGPFRKDLELIMDNAIFFNPPDDWIHKAAVALKKMAIKKIENSSKAAEGGQSGGYVRPKQKSVYVDEDSDVDMYEYESDQDEDYDGSRRTNKRKRSALKTSKEDSSLKGIERPIRLQKTLSDSLGLRGPFSNIPVNSDASTFSLPTEWTSRHSSNITHAEDQAESAQGAEREELDTLIAMHAQTEEREASYLRRSTRAHDHEPASSNGVKQLSMSNVEYSCDALPALGTSDENPLPRNRLEVELAREKYHEMHHARAYLAIQKRITVLADESNAEHSAESGFGLYSDGSFPPYLGRIVPEASLGTDASVTWELRAPYLIPALRWVLRGLIQSEHVAAVEEMPTDNQGGVIITNHAYHIDPSLTPFEIVDQKEMQRRKRANQEEEEDSEDDVELSEYEQLRAQRVARNAERLKALGLA